MAYAPTTPYQEMPIALEGTGHAQRGRPSFEASNRKNIYRGFSTTGTSISSFSLTDKQLVIRDLLNHIYTVPGQRVGRPDFGTLIPVVTFEGATPETISLIEKELRRVVDSDPRVELVKMAVKALPDNNAIVAIMDLKYIELDEVDSLRLTIGQE